MAALSSAGRAGRNQPPRLRETLCALGKSGASDAPYGFVFRMQQEPDGSLSLNLVAFGERHPDNPATRTVYERAHKRLHGRYP